MKRLLVILAALVLGISCSSEEIVITTKSEFTLDELSKYYFSSADTWVITDDNADTEDFEGLTEAIDYVSDYKTSYKISLEFPNIDSIPDYAIFGTMSYDSGVSTSAIVSVSASSATYFGKHAFRNCSSLVTVNIPEVTTLGQRALYSNASLETVNAPKITKIDQYTFSYCSSLETVNFPLATSVEGKAFMYCSSLSTIDLAKVTSVSSYAFYGCSSLVTAKFAELTTIGAYAFADCSNLITMELASSNGVKLESIDSSAFEDTDTSLITLTVGSENAEYVDTSVVPTLTIGDQSWVFADILVL